MKMLKHNVNKWEYELEENENSYPNLKVNPDKKVHDGQIPKLLSKYYALNSRNVNAFLNNEIYVSQPDQFNDLLDLNFLYLDFTKISFEQIIEVVKHLESNELDSLKTQFDADPIKTRNIIRNTLYQDMIQNYGILCLTSKVDNDLMWAHYTNNMGFAIEFDWKEFSNKYLGPFPINYFDKTKLNFSDVHIDLGLFIEALTKKAVWNYENEYRMFFLPPIKDSRFRISGLFQQKENELNICGKMFKLIDRKIKYNRSCIKRIVLGYGFFGNIVNLNKTKEIISENEFIINCDDELTSLRLNLLKKAKSENIKIELVNLNLSNYQLQPKLVHIEILNGTRIRIVKTE